VAKSRWHHSSRQHRASHRRHRPGSHRRSGGWSVNI